MFEIKNFKVETLSESNLNPIEFHFTQNTTKRIWELIDSQDTVCIILFNTTRDRLILLKRFEPAVYLLSFPKEHVAEGNLKQVEKYPAELGIVLELCRDKIDQITDKSMLQEIAKESILQRTGYLVSINALQFVSSYKSDVGAKCGENYVFYCELTDEMKVSECGTDVVELTISEMKEYVHKSWPEMRSTSCFLYTMLWFLNEKCYNFYK